MSELARICEACEWNLTCAQAYTVGCFETRTVASPSYKEEIRKEVVLKATLWVLAHQDRIDRMLPDEIERGIMSVMNGWIS